MTRRTALASLLSLGCATASSPATTPAAPTRPAETPAPSAALTERLDRVAEAFRSRGAQPVRERWLTFLRQGADDSFSLTLRREQCVGFVGVAREGVDDLDLRVFNHPRVEIDPDGRADAHPYVRVCGRAGDRLTVNLIASRGNGEAAVVTLAEPPVVAPPLSEVLGDRPRGFTAGVRRPRGAVGRDPSAVTVNDAISAAVEPLARLGYRPLGDARRGRLPGQRSTVERFEFQQGRCYVVLGVGGDNVDDLDLRVIGPDRSLLAQDLALDPRPATRFCARLGGAHAVEVRMFAGSGEWAVEALEIPTDGVEPVRDDIQGTARARLLEFIADARSRGLRPMGEPVRGAGWLDFETRLPLTMVGGRCYRVSAVPSDGLPAMDLWLARGDGAVLAEDIAARDHAEVEHCATTTTEATVRARVPTARGEWVLQVFESGGGR